MDSAKNQLVDRLKTANNILVTVSRNPSVDQLSALLGLTLLLNKYDKHAAAVFSGEVPSTIEFLKPEDTFEKNTDSLRDFIIALDKSKADKLRYKVEDDVVRIFITPYRTSITEADLDFSQGDFNVDVVVALGVTKQEDLDEAITTHGRILHDATVTSITLTNNEGLGSINWQDSQASSLSELVTELGQALAPELLDNQIATALLTGIVAETDRFSNQKTTAHTMSASAALMAAGADQQLVATKLNDNVPSKKRASKAGSTASKSADKPPKKDDGTLEIDHDSAEEAKPDAPGPQDEKIEAAEEAVDEALALPEPHSDETEDDKGPAPSAPEEPDGKPAEDTVSSGPKLVTEPPSLGGRLTANTQPETLDPSTDPLSLPAEEKPQLLSRTDETAIAPSSADAEGTKEEPAVEELAPAPADWMPPQADAQPEAEATQPDEKDASEDVTEEAELPAVTSEAEAPVTAEPAEPTAAASTAATEEPTPPAPSAREESIGQIHIGPDGTLADLEASVHSPHLDNQHVDSARDEVSKALNDSTASAPPQPIAALNAQPLGDALHPADPITGLAADIPPAVVPAAPAIDSVPPPPPAGMPPASNDVPLTPAPVMPAQQAPLADPSMSVPPASTPVAAPAPQVVDPNAPPPVPPPIPFQFGTPSTQDKK